MAPPNREAARMIVSARCASDDCFDGGANLTPNWSGQFLLCERRRVEDGERQEPEIDADGSQERDHVAPSDRLAAVGGR